MSSCNHPGDEPPLLPPPFSQPPPPDILPQKSHQSTELSTTAMDITAASEMASPSLHSEPHQQPANTGNTEERAIPGIIDMEISTTAQTVN
ncbi:hypothetical protein MRB53_002319 [Persea americana]|uniref:Uncharacterized protein n=1 Tax=Persea americana TaxID=3435 RepID=A0ACC2MV18_PERAE|nr:hypothetical protein MRB53_002319 [Persea americana]